MKVRFRQSESAPTSNVAWAFSVALKCRHGSIEPAARGGGLCFVSIVPLGIKLALCPPVEPARLIAPISMARVCPTVRRPAAPDGEIGGCFECQNLSLAVQQE